MATKKRGPFKGHCALCALNRGGYRQGKHCDPAPALRKLYGRRRRIPRHGGVPDDQERP